MRNRRSPRVRMPEAAQPKLIRSNDSGREIRDPERLSTVRNDSIGRAMRNAGLVEPDVHPRKRPPARRAPNSSVRLAPVRDTGIAVSGRVDRQRAARQRAAQRSLISIVIAVVCIGGILVGWRYSSDRNAQANPFSLGALLSANASSTVEAVVPVPDPTPIFAAYGDVQIRLPVAITQLNEVMFHQASGACALHMTSPLPDANINNAANSKGTGRDISTQATGANAVLVGQVMRVYRTGRTGKPDTAADVGAIAGTQVFSPVTGTVVSVKAYKLYSKYDDFEIHIQPDGHPELDVVLIHVTDVTATAGMKVTAGVTPIAAVRLLSNKIHDQLADYSTGTGDHVHIQVNNANYPGYTGLQGAVEAE